MEEDIAVEVIISGLNEIEYVKFLVELEVETVLMGDIILVGTTELEE